MYDSVLLLPYCLHCSALFREYKMNLPSTMGDKASCISLWDCKWGVIAWPSKQCRTTVQCSENYEEKGTPPKPQKRNRNPKRREANHGHKNRGRPNRFRFIDTDTRGKLLIGQLALPDDWPGMNSFHIPQLDLSDSEFFLGWCSQLQVKKLQLWGSSRAIDIESRPWDRARMSVRSSV